MKKRSSRVLACVSRAVPAAPGSAGRVRRPRRPRHRAARPINMDEMRRHIYVMEGALAQAVDFGAKQLNRQILPVMPGVFMLEGEARARGVHLDGYGVFFDVRVPMMRQSMVWSLRMMIDQDDAANQAAGQRPAQADAGHHRPAAPAPRWRKRSASSNGRPPGAAARNQQVDARARDAGCGVARGRCGRRAAGISSPRPAPMPPPTASGRRIRTAPIPKR